MLRLNLRKKTAVLLRDHWKDAWYYFERAPGADGKWTVYRCTKDFVQDTRTGLSGNDAYKHYTKYAPGMDTEYHNTDAKTIWHKLIGQKSGRTSAGRKTKVGSSVLARNKFAVGFAPRKKHTTTRKSTKREE